MGNPICNLKNICGVVTEKQTIITLMNNNNTNTNISPNENVFQNASKVASNTPSNSTPFKEPDNTTLNYIESYNAYNNFYFLINRVTFLQRKIKSFLHKKKTVTKESITTHNSSLSNHSYPHKKQMLLQSIKQQMNKTHNKRNSKGNENMYKNIKITDENESIILLCKKHNDHTQFLFGGGTTFIGNNSSIISHINYNNSYRRHTDVAFYSNSISLKNDELLNQKEIKGYFLKKQKKYTYKGQVDGRKKTGFGIVTWEDKSCLHAYFENSKTQGFCKFHDYQNDSMFTGLYVNNRPNGYGVFYKSKVTYEGMWVNNNLIGVGIEIWKDDTYYQGDFDNSVKKGYGLYRWADGSIYQGEWENNQMNGIGMLIYSDERMYRGEFRNGIMDGFGEFVWSNEKKYVGYYKDNKKNGFGLFVSEVEPLMAYIGFWEDGKLNGVGIKASKDVIKYGYWKEGKKEQTLPGSWSVGKYFTGRYVRYLKFFTLPEKDILEFIYKYGIS